MPTFKYRGINQNGRKVGGSVIAANDYDLEERLRTQGIDLINFRAVKSGAFGFAGKVNIKDLIVFCLHMEQLDRAGVPLLEALADARDSTDSARLKDIMTDVYERVKNGELLSQALSKYPTVFNNVFIGLIKTGEKTGHLAEAFEHLSEHMKWVNDIRRKVRKALGYPIALTIVIIAVISILMTYVVPKLIAFIITQGFDIPLHTRALISFSGAFTEYWYLMFGLPLVSVIALVVMYKVSDNFAYKFNAFTLKLPVLGPTLQKIDLARFTHFFSVMFNSGIDILEALDTAKTVVSNRVIRKSVIDARQLVSDGSSLTAALRSSGHFPNLVVRMFKVGEDSGNMSAALDNVNFFYDREVNDSVDNMVGMIQPTLTIVLGLMILWIISAIFGPLYDSFSKMDF